MISRLALLGGVLLLAGCTWGNPPPPVAGSRAIYVPETITVVCDRGHLVYRSDKGHLAVVAGGCPPDQKP
jgi:hypothetical protein